MSDYENQKESSDIVSRAFKALRKEYVVVGKTRIRGWHAWLLIGVLAGIATGVVLVSNRSGTLEGSQAQVAITDTTITILSPVSGQYFLAGSQPQINMYITGIPLPLSGPNPIQLFLKKDGVVIGSLLGSSSLNPDGVEIYNLEGIKPASINLARYTITSANAQRATYTIFAGILKDPTRPITADAFTLSAFSAYHESGAFQVQLDPTITLLSPNGGQEINATGQSITWQLPKYGSSQQVTITARSLAYPTFITYNLLSTNSTNNDGHELTNPIGSIPSGLYVIEVSTLFPDGTIAYDRSNSPVKISSPVVSNSSPSITSMGTIHSLSVGVSHIHSGALATDSNGNLSKYIWSWVSCPSITCPSLSGASGSISGGSASIPGPTFTPNNAGSYTLRHC